jgi:hypothetical protein
VDVRRGLLLAVSAAYLGWAVLFILRSSAVAWDGIRYFCLFDDAMISMRYAQNLVQGDGLVWAAGDRVEGYSNFLMVLCMAVLQLFFGKASGVLAVQVFGAGLMLGIAWNVMKILESLVEPRDAMLSRAIPVLGFAAALAYYPLNYWSLMGMETGLLAFLLVVATRFALGFGRNPEGAAGAMRLYGLALAMGAAFLTRIDSVIFGLPLGLYVLGAAASRWSARTPKEWMLSAWKGFGGPLLVFLGMVLAHEIFRLVYYGQVLPNTFALKLTGMPIPFRLRDGWEFVRPFLNESKWVLALAVSALAFGPRKPRLLLAGLGGLGLCYQVWNGGDPWNYWRMMAPGMPLLFALVLLGLGSMVTRALPARAEAVGVGLVALVAAFAVYKANHRFREEWTLRTPARYADNHANLVNTSLALAAMTTPDATLGVFWAGTPPYYADRDGVDFLGKNDARIARLKPDTSGRISWNGMRSVPGHNKYDLDYSIKTLLPTWVEGFKWGSQDLEVWAKDHYVTAVYRGVRLHLLKDSPAVRWERADSLIRWDGEERLRSW